MNRQFSFTQTEISGLLLITPFVSHDSRGSFIKDYSKEVFMKNGVDYSLEEVFYSFSQKNVVRGLHFQREKQQAKLVRCISGKIFDAVVDLRQSSPTFKKWLSFELSDDNNNELLVPVGCGHGFMALEDSLVAYKCGEKFISDYDDGIIWNDPDIGIEWPLSGDVKVIQSEKDENLQTFAEFSKRYGTL